MARTTRGAFHRQGLFVGSGGLYSPGPATASPLSLRETTAGRRSHVIPSLWPVLHRFPAKADTPAILFIDEVPGTLAPDASPTRPPFTLTATLFGALRASLFGARTLPADFCNEPRRTDVSRSSRFLAGTEAMTSFRFLTRHARPSLARSGDARRAAHRPSVRAPVPVPPACAGLPDRDTEPNAPPPTTCAAGV